MSRLRDILASEGLTREAFGANPHARKYTYESFGRDYYQGNPPPARVARQFWDDFQNAVIGDLDEYIAYTRS